MTYNRQPILSARKYFESLQNSLNLLEREDLALADMTHGEVILTGSHQNQTVLCRFKSENRSVEKKPTPPLENIDNHTAAATACEALGVKYRKFKSSTGLSELPQFKSIPNPTFTVGILKTTGYLFIPAFGTYGYFETCQSAWTQFQKTFEGKCDKKCNEQFTFNILWQTLTDDLEKAVKDLNAAKVSKLIVDVTQNGGGSNWVDIAARVLSPTKVQCQEMALVKSTGEYEGLKEAQKEFAADFRTAQTPEVRALLTAASENVESMLKDFENDCDRQKYWTIRGYQSACTNLIHPRTFACGYVAYAPAVKDLNSRDTLFGSSNFNFTESLFKGKLIIFTDRKTSSSAEEFVSLLVNNVPGVQVIGEHTHSTGCGYHNGGNPAKLKYSGIEVSLPNCIRYTKRGSNEVFGLSPDIKVNWREMTKEGLIELVD